MEPVATTPLSPIVELEHLVEHFGEWIVSVFHHSNDIYNTFTEEEKKAGVWASGVIAVINANLDTIPAGVIDILKIKFPDLSLDVLHGFLDDVRTKVDNLQSEIPLTLEDAIAWAQKYLGQHKDDHSAWSIISTSVVNILATLFSPETPVEKFIQVGLIIYHAIVKPHVTGAAVAAATPAPPAAPEEVNPPQGSITPPASPAVEAPAGTEVTSLAALDQAEGASPATQGAPTQESTADNAGTPAQPETLTADEQAQVNTLEQQDNLSYDEAIAQLKREQAAADGTGEQA